MTLDQPHLAPALASHFVGVEVGRGLIRAGVFGEGLRLLGNAKFSTKLERGPEAVLGRIARCVRYAADECNLEMPQIQRIAVGIRGWIDEPNGMVRKTSELAWQNLPVGPTLQDLLSIPVSVANSYNLATLGILTHELKDLSGSALALFVGAELGGALLRGGAWTNLAARPETAGLLEAPEENVFRTFASSEFCHFRGRDFRKALRKGSPAAELFLRHAADAGATIAAQLIRRVQPDIIAVSGGAIEDIHDTILRDIQAKVAGAGLDGWTSRIRWISSRLGDAATITGAGAWAAQLAGGSTPRSERAGQPMQQDVCG